MCNNAIAYSLIILSYQDKSVVEIIGEHVDWSVVYTVSLVVALLGMTHVVHTIRRKGRVATKIVSEGDVDVVDNDDTVDSQK
jgi:Na+/alanine symporter